ncbi:MAG: YbaK/EbsC family protein [Candidatus Paceibacterota bacterium]
MIYHQLTEIIKRILTNSGYWFETFEHEPVRTSEEASRVRTGYTIDQGAKALITRVKKPGVGKLFVMFVVQGSKKFDTAKIKEQFGLSDIRFATEEEVLKITNGVLLGGVPPFGNLFNLSIYVDRGLLQQEKIIFNAGDKSFSIGMKSTDYADLVNPIIGDIV